MPRHVTQFDMMYDEIQRKTRYSVSMKHVFGLSLRNLANVTVCVAACKRYVWG